MILKGQPVADKIFAELRLLGKPKGKFVAIQIGANPISSFYVEKKKQAALMLGIDFEALKIPESDAAALEEKIHELNNDQSVRSIMVQIPLPANLNREKIAAEILPQKDIDGFSYVVGSSDFKYFPPTVLAIDELLNFYKISKKDKKILIVGEGFLVGRPLSGFWRDQGLDVEILRKDAADYFEKLRSADIVVLATGADLRLKENNFKQGATVIDASTVAEDDKIRGDVNSVGASRINLAPVPGGVGPLTIAMLFKNFLS